MAEVVGLTSGIVGLVSAVLSVSHISFEFVTKAKKAPASVSRYLQEILALSSTLLKVQDTLAFPAVVSAVSTEKDLLPASLISECEKELETLRQKLQKRAARTGHISKLHALSWPFEEKETKDLVDRIARWNSIFGTIINTCNLSVGDRSCQTAALTDDLDALRKPL
jgi:hypothetical protein